MAIPLVISNNPFKKELTDMLLEGKSIKQVVQFLEEMGHPVSRNTLGKYKREELDINAKAVDVYLEETKLNEKVEEQVSTLKLYDKIIQAGASINTTMIDEARLLDSSLKAAKQKEDFLREHGDKESEIQSQLLKEIRDELRMQDLTKLIEGLSDERTKKRLSQATTTT